jgi:ribonuclease P protein component
LTETQRFPKSRRILRRGDFVRVQKSSARVSTRHFLLLLSPGLSATAPPRLGIVASRKVGSAVVRNRAKRLLREAFRLHGELFPPGADVVVIIRSGVENLCLADVRSQLERAAPEIVRKAAKLWGGRS